MTEEERTEQTKESCHCICKSEGFRKFIIVALGTFVGGFCAISLFAALHKPPMFCPAHRCMMMPMPMPMEYNNPFEGNMAHFKNNKHMQQRDFDKKFQPRESKEMR